MPTAEDIIREARTWVGTPFRHQGRIKGVAGDCAAPVQCVANALGISDFVIRNYGREPVPEKMRKVLEEKLDPVEKNKMAPGDILWMRFGSNKPSHLAILTDTGTIIHANERLGRCCEHILDEKWRKRIHRVYRYRGPS